MNRVGIFASFMVALAFNKLGATESLENEEFLIISLGGINTPIPMPPHIDYFRSTQTTIDYGDSITLSWDTYKANSVTLNGLGVTSPGSQAFTLNNSGSYTLSMHGEYGIVSSSLYISIDTDRDGFRDEVDSDDDNDGMQDILETKWGLNPRDASDAHIDSDSDGISNIEEVLEGTDPFSNDEYPRLTIKYFAANTQFIRPENSLTLSWESAGATKVQLYKNDAIIQDELQASGTLTLRPGGLVGDKLIYKLVLKGPEEQLLAQTWSLEVTDKIDLANGQVWIDNLPVDNAVGSSMTVPSANPDSIYLGDYQNNYHKISSQGELVWSLSEFGLVMSKATLLDNQGQRLLLGGALENQKGKVALIDTTSVRDQLVWEFQAQAAILSSPALDLEKNRVYTVDFEGNIYALNLATGQQLWMHALGTHIQVRSSPVLKNDGTELVIRTKSNHILAIDLAIAESHGIAAAVNAAQPLNGESAESAVKWDTALGGN